MGDFKNNKEIYMTVPEGFKQFYPRRTHGYIL